MPNFLRCYSLSSLLDFSHVITSSSNSILPKIVTFLYKTNSCSSFKTQHSRNLLCASLKHFLRHQVGVSSVLSQTPIRLGSHSPLLDSYLYWTLSFERLEAMPGSLYPQPKAQHRDGIQWFPVEWLMKSSYYPPANLDRSLKLNQESLSRWLENWYIEGTDYALRESYIKYSLSKVNVTNFIFILTARSK